MTDTWKVFICMQGCRPIPNFNSTYVIYLLELHVIVHEQFTIHLAPLGPLIHFLSSFLTTSGS